MSHSFAKNGLNCLNGVKELSQLVWVLLIILPLCVWMDRGGCGGMHAHICACTFTHSSVYVLCVCMRVPALHGDISTSCSQAVKPLGRYCVQPRCPPALRETLTGTVFHPGSTARAFICQICPRWASTLSPPAPSTGTAFIRAQSATLHADL